MRKIYKKLTEDQIRRGVKYSSTLSTCTTEQPDDTTHEVKELNQEGFQTIARLENDSFFNKSHWVYNIIRRGE